MSASLHTHQVAEAKALLAQGWKQAAVAAQLGLTASKLCRLLQRDANGEELGPRHATGPRDLHELTSGEKAVIVLGMLQKNSRRLAAQMLMDSTECTDETFARLAAVFDRAAEQRVDEVWPAWFARACVLTEEQRQGFRGAKHLAAVEPARRRGRFFLDEEGNKVAMFPNAVWKFDDMSRNQPSVEIGPDGKPRVHRQGLYVIDQDSAFMLGFVSIARASDGYRLADQADFFLELVDQYGLPMRVMIERGPWDNNFWFGVPLPHEWTTRDCVDYRFGGIDVAAGGPVKVMQAFKSRHKGLIEGSFNHLQNLAAHQTTDIGRYRGEHEAAAKKITRLQNLKDEDLIANLLKHFPDAVGGADIEKANIDRFNHELKRRKNYWGFRKQVPAEVYATAIKRELSEADRWRFLPVKKTCTMSGANLNLKVKDYDLPFQFTAEGFEPTWDYRPYIPAGWRMFAVFHPEQPELGCRIFNAMHPDHRDNPQRIPLGMAMGVLQCVETPAFSDRGDFAGRKATHAAYRREMRLATNAGKTVRVSTVVADGLSRTLRSGSPNPLRTLHPAASNERGSSSTREPAAAPRRDVEDAAALAALEAARADRIARLRELEEQEALF